MPIGDIRENRLKKLEALRKAGINPYPGKAERTNLIRDVLFRFSSLAKAKKRILLVGRLRSIREHGGLTFANIEDASGQIQIYLKKDELDPDLYQQFLDNFDIGDFIGVSGSLLKTKKGEKTLSVREFVILAKAILPLPEKWHGFQDVEERFRKRYLDLIMNPEVRAKFEIRFSLIREIRNFLDENGFLEVETPVLQALPGGAAARPFKTHLNALNVDLYLRVSPELYLKRLLVGGFEKVYEIGRCFRNEGIDAAHNPDFTMLEFYWAYQNYEGLMDFTEKLFSYLFAKISPKSAGKSKFMLTYQGNQIDFKPKWLRVEYAKLLKDYAKIDWEKSDYASLVKAAKNLKLEVKNLKTKAEVIDEIFKKIVRPKIIQPTFVINYPLELSPLAKQDKKNPKVVLRFQLVVSGMEIVNAFSELNDPLEQRRRFEEQERARVLGSEEAQRLDEDFIEALEYGMPPAAGLGMGIDRLALLFTDSHSVREIILFPTMRPK